MNFNICGCCEHHTQAFYEDRDEGKKWSTYCRKHKKDIDYEQKPCEDFILV